MVYIELAYLHLLLAHMILTLILSQKTRLMRTRMVCHSPILTPQRRRIPNNHLQRRNITKTTTQMKRLPMIVTQAVRYRLVRSRLTLVYVISSDMFHEQSGQEDVDESFDEREWR